MFDPCTRARTPTYYLDRLLGATILQGGARRTAGVGILGGGRRRVEAADAASHIALVKGGQAGALVGVERTHIHACVVRRARLKICRRHHRSYVSFMNKEDGFPRTHLKHTATPGVTSRLEA